MSDHLQELTAFVRAAETGSFSRVAREFGVSQPSVSRMVASLEARLGVKLLLRTTRQVTPTDAGSVLLERARQVLGDLEDAENATRGIDSLSGTLRVAMSGAFGTREVIPHLPAFLARHPQLRIDLLISDRVEDLVAEGVDMALRLARWLSGSNREGLALGVLPGSTADRRREGEGRGVFRGAALPPHPCPSPPRGEGESRRSSPLPWGERGRG